MKKKRRYANVSTSGRMRDFLPPRPGGPKYRILREPRTVSYWVRPADADGPLPDR